MTTIDNLNDLHALYNDLPEGTTADVNSSDLDAGNFDTASFQMPDGTIIDVSYTGPVAEEYVSPFETQSEEDDQQ